MGNSALLHEKARKLRFRKSAARGLTLDEIRDTLWEIQDRCEEVIWWCDNDSDCVDALIGDEDSGEEFKMQMSDLQSDVERMVEDLRDAYVPECFDAFFVDMTGGSRMSQLMWYDESEQDYFSLEPWENEYARDECHKKLMRMTKEELLEATAYCLKIYTSFLSLRTRAAELEAALDILRDRNGDVLKAASSLNRAYDDYVRSGCWGFSAEAGALDRIAGAMPSEAWLM